MVKGGDTGEEERHINILWTGGLDSTYRMVELSRRPCIVQPYYVLDNRASQKQELHAMESILRLLREDKKTRATLLDTIHVNEESLSTDYQILDSWLRLFPGRGTRSKQYYYLAIFAEQHHLHLEIGIQFSPNGTVAKAIDEPLLIPHPDADYDALMIDHSRADQDTINLFGHFYFPKSLYHKMKNEEVEDMQAMGAGEIIKHIWFCLTPIMGHPCGHCLPCRSTEKEGEKIPITGKILYSTLHPMRKSKKLKQRIKKISSRTFQLYNSVWDRRLAGNSLDRTAMTNEDYFNISQSASYLDLHKLFHDDEFCATDRFIDAGCGKGRTLAFLLKNKFPGSITGVEQNPETAAVAQQWTQKRHTKINIITSNAFNIDYNDYTVVYLCPPAQCRYFLQFIELLESQLTHPLRLYYITDTFGGNSMGKYCEEYTDKRPGWELKRRGISYRKHGLFLHIRPWRYSCWTYTPQKKDN